MKTETKNQFVLIALCGGLVDQVTFYPRARSALEALSKFVKTMNIENQDAYIYNPDGYYANAKDFLDKESQYIENPETIDQK